MSPVARLLARLVVGVVLVVSLTAAAPPNDHERYVLDRTNWDRGTEGVAPLALKDMLTDRARAWAADLARRGTLQHSDLRTIQPGWTEVGENVGRSTSVEDVMRRLEASPSHRRNLLAGKYTRIGIGTARAADGNIYVVQVFWRGCGTNGQAHCAR